MALDPVGKEDKDIDNDGKLTKADKYLHARRRAIAKKMKEEVELDEVSDDLKARYLDKAVQHRYDRFIKPRNTSAPKLKGSAKKAADAAREKANAKDTRRAGIMDKTAEKLTGKPHYNKMSTMTTPAVHGNADDWWKGKKYSKEEVELDEVSASTLRNYIDKSRADKKVAIKDRTAAEKNIRIYGGMAMDKKERDNADRRAGNRSQGISVANQKLGTYPKDKVKAKVMAREEVELDEALKYANVNLKDVKATLDAHRATGEIARHLGGGKIAYTGKSLTKPNNQ